jgi:hypothetical protein
MLANSDVTGLGGPGMMEPMFPPEPPAAPEPAPMMYSPMRDEEIAPPKPRKAPAKKKAKKARKAKKKKATRPKAKKPARKAKRAKARKPAKRRAKAKARRKSRR